MTSLLFYIGKRLFEQYRRSLVDETCYLVIMIWLCIILFAGFGVTSMINRSRLARAAQMALLPGLVIRDLFKAAGCLVTGTTITNFNLFRYNEPRLQHERSRMGVVGEFLVAAIPFVLMVLTIGVVSAGFENQPIEWSAEPTHKLSLSLEGAENYAVHLVKIVFGTYRDVAGADLGELDTWIYLAVLVVLSLAMTPEKGELKYLFVGFLIYGFGFFFLHRVGLDLLQYGRWKSLHRYFLGELGIVASILLLLLAIGGVVHGIGYLVQVATGEAQGEGTRRRAAKAA